jgi:hypothetical protein
MAFYPQFPAFYAYPMPYPNQEFYAMYPPNPVNTGGHVYYQDTTNPTPNPTTTINNNNNNGNNVGIPYSNIKNEKPGYGNRKESQDSGISDFSSSSRKVSNSSTISNSSIMEEPGLDDVKEEDTPFETPDDDLCVQIVQQVKTSSLFC